MVDFGEGAGFAGGCGLFVIADYRITLIALIKGRGGMIEGDG